MQPMGRRWTTIAILGLSALLVGGIPAVFLPTAAGASPNPSAPPQQWAYGAEHRANASVTGLYGQYQVSAFFGWTVIYTLTNTSNTSFTIEAQRSMAVSYAAQLCAPSCTNPNAVENLSVRGQENDTAFANFTTTGTVYENGTAASAVALANTHSTSVARLDESVAGSRTTAGVSHSGSAMFDINGSARSSVSFATPLGLIPWNASPGLTWNASAPFTASGGFYLQYAWSLVGANGSLSGNGTPSGQLNRSGTVALQGTDLGNVTLANGVTVPAIVLAWTTGTFVAVDGILLIPRGFDIFGAGDHPWAPHAPGIQTVLNSRIDVLLDVAHHRLRVAAAASQYAGSDSLAPASGGAAASPAASPVTPATPTTVQAEPMTVASAQATNACLSNGCVGGSSGSPSGALRPLTTFLVVGVVVAAVLGTVGVIEYRIWARKRSSQTLVGGYAGQMAPPAAPGKSADLQRIPPPPSP